jgi:UDP-3-O-[3-hydroxymyristoyl] glucosamine N-acyltransferase
MKINLRELADLVDGDLRGDPDCEVENVAPIDRASGADVAYVESEKRTSGLKETGAAVVLISRTAADGLKFTPVCALIVVDDAQQAFIAAMLHFRPPRPRRHTGLSPAAHVDPSVEFGADCNVGPGASIGTDVVIGARCDIHPGAVIGDGCRLGDDVTVHANAVLYHDVTIGHRVILHAGAVIGADGFGYRFEEGRYIRIPHTGTVIVEDDVEIGAGTTVDRAMIGATVIGEGTKLDNQIMIAHNCVLGKHNAFASQVGFAGSVTTGDYVRCAGQVGVANHAHLGTGCSLGAKAGVAGVVPAGETYHGYPAGPEREAVKAHLSIRRLPEMRTQLRQLQQQVERLQQQITSIQQPPEERAAA